MYVVDMQTLEAMISLTFFLLFSTYMLTQLDYTKPNYALYQYQLANDIWRVVYLKGGLRDYSPANHAHTEAILTEIKELTGFCSYIQGTRTTATGCRGRFATGCSDDKIVMKKAWFDGEQPSELTFTVCVPK